MPKYPAEPAHDPRSQLLRRAGHAEAADLLDELAGFAPIPAPPAPTTTPPPAIPALSAPMDRDRAEGEALIAAMRRAGIIAPAAEGEDS